MWKKNLCAFGLGLIVFLLILQRAPQPQRTLTVIGESGAVSFNAHRGATISTGADGQLTFIMEGIKVELKENTDVRLDRIFKDDVRLFVSRGQITTTRSNGDVGDFHASSDRVRCSADPGEALTFINYDFQERVSVIPITGTIEISVNGVPSMTLRAEDKKYADISELAPYLVTQLQIK